MLMGTSIPPATERRIRREGRSAALRERALRALGVSSSRSLQLVRKAELIRKKGAPSQGRPPHSDDPLAAGRTEFDACTVYAQKQA
jgi:hypothetical protein